MAETNTPLQQQPDPPIPPKAPSLAERLRRWRAAVHVRLELTKHNLNKTRKASARASVRRLRSLPVYRMVGAALYDIGFQTEYAFVRMGRYGRYALQGVWRGLGYLGRRLLWTLSPVGLTLWEDILLAPFTLVKGVVHIGQTAVRTTRQEGLFAAIWASVAHLGRGVWRYARLLPRLLIYALPVVVGVLCWGYVQDTLGRNYALAVDVDGQTVGYVSGESIFESAKASVNERISYAGTSNTGWSIQPAYRLATVEEKSQLMTEKRMADAILATASDQIQEGTALYIDGQLRQVTTEGAALKGYLEELKAPYVTDDPDTTVTFNHEVELVDGIYFNDSFTGFDEIRSYLASDEVKQLEYTIVAGDSMSRIASKNGLTQAELYALNPGMSATSKIFPGDKMIVQKQETVLEVRIRKNVVYTEPIAYSTKTTSSSEYKFGTTKVIVEGVDGVREVTAQQTYDANGVLLENNILSTQVLQEPVTRQVVRGTRLDSGDIGKLGSGTFLWPCPGYRRVSRWLKPGHKGVDITGAIGTPIYASDAGVVIKAGMNRAGAGSNYGLSFIIDHGNGYRTLYAHCNTLYVSAGQAVSQGQLVATLGNTGRSTGPHLHFEIIQSNGVRVPPQNVFGKK